MKLKPLAALLVLLIINGVASFAQDLAVGPANIRMRQSYTFTADGKLAPTKVFRTSATKSDFVNAVGAGFYGLPEALVGAQSLLANFEFERFVSNRASVVVRLEYIGYSYTDDEPSYRETGSGTGAGIGFSYRRYFSEYGGFFISPSVEFAIVNWDYNYVGKSYFDSESGTGTSLAIAPNFAFGYRFNIGDHFAITPSLMAGYRIGIGIEHEGEAAGESGPLGGVGASFSFRF